MLCCHLPGKCSRGPIPAGTFGARERRIMRAQLSKQSAEVRSMIADSVHEEEEYDYVEVEVEVEEDYDTDDSE